MDKQIRARKEWVKLYLETKDAVYVCRRCGISRPTLRKWYRRYLDKGESGLYEQARRPKSFPRQKVVSQHIRVDIRFATKA